MTESISPDVTDSERPGSQSGDEFTNVPKVCVGRVTNKIEGSFSKKSVVFGGWSKFKYPGTLLACTRGQSKLGTKCIIFFVYYKIKIKNKRKHVTMSSDNSVRFSVKTVLRNDIHRLNLGSASFANLYRILLETYLLPADSPLFVKYKDEEGDLVTVSTDPELAEAFRLCAGAGSNKVLKLFVSTDPASAESPKRLKAESPIAPSPLSALPPQREPVSTPPAPNTSFSPLDPRDPNTPLHLALSLLRDRSVIAALPTALQIGLFALCEGEELEDVVQAMVASSDDIQLHPAWQQFSPFLARYLAHLKPLVDRLRQTPQQLAMLQSFIQLLLPSLPQLLEQSLATLSAASSASAGGSVRSPLDVWASVLNAGGSRGVAVPSAGFDLGSLVSLMSSFAPFASSSASAPSSSSPSGPTSSNASPNSAGEPASTSKPVEAVHLRGPSHSSSPLYSDRFGRWRHRGRRGWSPLPHHLNPFGQPHPFHAPHHGFGLRPPPPPPTPFVGEIDAQVEGSGGNRRFAESSSGVLSHTLADGRSESCGSWRSSYCGSEESSKPRGAFVGDVNLPPRSVVGPNQTVIKTWRLQNTATNQWPEGTRLVFLRGERGLSTEEEFEVPRALPGQVVEVSAVLNSGPNPGRQVAYFRLADANREMFGPRVWADLVVAVEHPSNKSEVTR